MKHRSEQQLEGTTRPSQLSFFNRQTGSNAVVQTKLTVGSANDAHEHEANQTADMVMRKPLGQIDGVTRSHPVNSTPTITPIVQRACAHCEQEKEQTAQRKETGAATGGFTAPPSVSKAISRSGQGLDSNAKTFMESRFNRSFDNVQVHTDGESAASARDISARAYTSGNHIVFGDGQYQPNTEGGRHLLAHELTHVVQQNGSDKVQRDPLSPIHSTKCNDYLYWSLKPLAKSRYDSQSSLLSECPALEKVTEANLLSYVKENGAEITKRRILGSHEFTGTDEVRKLWSEFVLKYSTDERVQDKTTPKSALTVLTWEDKLAGFDHQSSEIDEIKIFYKDLLEQEIQKVFNKTEVVDVRLQGDSNCNPSNLTLMLENSDDRNGDYVAPDKDKEKAAKEDRLSIDLGRTRDIKSIDDPEILCRRVFLNDIVKANPQKFHATYFHESMHDEHRKKYIKYFREWKKVNEKSKHPKGFLTWIREKLVGKSAIDLALVEEDHAGLTATSFTESMAHLQTFEWQANQKTTTEDAIKSRFLLFGDYASGISGNVIPVIKEFVKVYKSLSTHKKTIAELIEFQVKSGDKKSVFYAKLAEAIKGL
jgi:Domain of unknown function (DUF4157)